MIVAGAIATLAACGGCGTGVRPNVVLITLDTARADHLGCYGYERNTSPNLDRMAAESVLYLDATSTASWTLPAHASLFTGKFTSSHGARYDAEGPLLLTSGIRGPKSWDKYRARGLSPEETTLAQLLGRSEYATGAVIAGPWMKRVFGLDKGFQHYDDANVDDGRGRLAKEVTEQALTWIDSVEEGPFFLFLNYYDPHSPYGAPPPFTFTFYEGKPSREALMAPENYVDFYDGEIRYADHHLGALLQGLKSRGLYDDTLVVVTADHGELFGEHGQWGHGNFLYQEEIHIPLIVKYPRGAVSPRRVPGRVQSTDVLPLILEQVDLALPPGIQGGVPAEVGHPTLAEAYPLPAISAFGDWRVLFDGSHKLAWNSHGKHLLFDLARDPDETVNLAAQAPDRVARMTELLEAYLSSLPAPHAAAPATELDEETMRALQSLGYVR